MPSIEARKGIYRKKAMCGKVVDLRFIQIKFLVSTCYKNAQKQSLFTAMIPLVHLRANPEKPFIK